MRTWWIGVVMLAAAPAIAAPPAAKPVTVAQKTADYDFSYSYPAAAARIAPLRRWLDADRAALRAEVVHDAAAERAWATKQDNAFHQHDGTKEWKVVTDTPRVLSLSSETYRFTGGAHGGTIIGTLVWDKAKARRVEPRAMFVSAQALQDVLGATWCDRLKAERLKRVGAELANDAMFPCPKIAELTLLLGSTNARAIDRIGLIAGQYVAGPYVEGMYDITFPVTPALLRIVKPEWRGVFAIP